MDLGTWRLVGFGILGLGSVATVVAIVAIIAMFRAAKTGDDATHDAVHGDVYGDDDDDDDHDDYLRRDQVAAGATALGGEVGTTALAVQASRSAEPYVVSPDWYGHSNVIDDGPVHSDVARDAVASFGAGGQPITVWAAEPADSGSVDVEPVAPVRRPDPRPMPDALAANRQPESATDAPIASHAPRIAPVRHTPQRPVIAWTEEPTGSSPVDVEPAAPARSSRHGVSSSEPMTAPARATPEQTPVIGRRRRAVDPGTEAADPKPVDLAPLAPVRQPHQPNAAAREEVDSPIADWYDDPDGSGGERWWDGKGWTRHRRQRPDPDRLPAAEPPTTEPGPDDRRRAAPEPPHTASRPAGWYRDPSSGGRRRFWNGSGWDSGS